MGGSKARVTIDGTNMPVQYEWDPRFMSHKFMSNALKYEIGVCIKSGNIVWINGPFCGGEHDITIARQAVIDAMDEDEMAEADGGYEGEKFSIKIPDDAKSKDEGYMKQVARSRHETANKRFKIFEILRKRFRHDLEKHSECFRAVVVLTQLSIEHESPLYSVEYFDEMSTNVRDVDFELEPM
jgi:hypothetical protein